MNSIEIRNKIYQRADHVDDNVYSCLEFTEWKSSFEQSSGSKYVKNCGSKGKSENQTTEYYYCNRTGPCKHVYLSIV
jgi:hypothetical protein